MKKLLLISLFLSSFAFGQTPAPVLVYSFLQGPTLPAGWTLLTAYDIDGNGEQDLILLSSERKIGIWLIEQRAFKRGFYGPIIPTGFEWIGSKGDLVFYNPTTRQMRFLALRAVFSSPTPTATATPTITPVPTPVQTRAVTVKWGVSGRDAEYTDYIQSTVVTYEVDGVELPLPTTKDAREVTIPNLTIGKRYNFTVKFILTNGQERVGESWSCTVREVGCEK